MKVLHIINSLDIGGAESLLAALLESWDGDHHILVLQGKGPLGPRLEKKAASVVYIGASKASFDFFKMLGAAQQTVNLLRPDIIHSHLVQSDLVSLLVKVRGAQRITSIHVASIQPTDPPRSRMIARVVALLSQRFAVAIATSSRSFMYANELKYKCSITVINNGTPRVSKVRSFRAESVTFLSLARFNPVKGHEILLEAFEQHLSSYPASRLICAGAGVTLAEPDFSTLVERTIRRKSTLNSIDFLGPQLDVSALFAQASALIISSKSETFPMVGSEACMHGIPVITTDVGDARAFALNENLVASPSSVSELRASLDFYAELTPKERLAISTLSRQKALQEFDIAKTASLYVDVYRSALATREYPGVSR